MMDYVSVEEARFKPGLRLALTVGVPGPWSMSAKAILEFKGLDYLPVAQQGGGRNEELVAWTGHRNAPILVYNNEAPRVHWLEILTLAERLAPEPALLPAAPEDRALAVGYSQEIGGENGFAWNARLFMLDAMVRARGEEAMANPMLRDYHYSPDVLDRALARVQVVLDALAARLNAQKAAGSDYFVGEAFSALDLYWCYFSQLLVPLAEEQCATPKSLRRGWGTFTSRLDESGYEADPVLIAHRDAMFGRHLPLPLVF